MGFKANLKGIIPHLRKKALNFFGGSFFGDEENQEKLPVFPEWFFTAKLGQPRQSNLSEIRVFAKSPWIQIANNTIRKEVGQIPYSIVLEDDESEEDIKKYQEDIDKVEDFLKNINTNKETIYDLMDPIIMDLGEIDAGVWTKVFSVGSYTIENVDVYDAVGRKLGTEPRLVLKPFGQRELTQLWYADGATFLFNIDIFRRLRGYYQYTFKHPRAAPILFENDEVVYFMMNRRSYTLYGFAPTQACQQEVELMMQSTRYNKDRFIKNMIPDGIMTLEDADQDSLDKLKDDWEEKIQGKPHKLLFINSKGDLQIFNQSNQEMQWIEGQKWYFHIIFAQFGMSPAEVGFHEDVNRSTQEGQERVTVKNAVKPFLKKFEDKLNNDIIPELLQQEKPKIKLKFNPKDHAEEQIEFDQNMKELDQGTMTINEYRKMKGRDDVKWGDDPKEQQQSITFNGKNDPNNPDNAGNPGKHPDNKPKPGKPNKPKKSKFASRFEKFLRKNV